MLRAIDGKFDMINFKFTPTGIVMLKYKDQIQIKQEYIENSGTRYLAKGSDIIKFFKNPKNAYEDNIIDYDLKDEKLICIFAEDSRRFVLSADLETKEITQLAEWVV